MKQTVKLNESQLRQLVAECVKKVLRETEEFNTPIPEDEMQEGYLRDALSNSFKEGMGASPEDIAGFRERVTKDKRKNYIKTGDEDADPRWSASPDRFARALDSYKEKKAALRDGESLPCGYPYEAAESRPGVIGRIGRRAMVGAAEAGIAAGKAKRGWENFKYDKLGLAKPYKK